MAAVTATKKSRPAASSPSRGEFVYLTLRRLLHEGKFKPGERLSERDLAAALHVSRTPIREAVRRLEADGLLRSEARRGLLVTEFDQRQLFDLYAFREVLEGFAARLAAQTASAGEIGLMKEIVRREGRTSDPGRIRALNRQFHLALARAARNEYLGSVLTGIVDATGMLPGTTLTGKRSRSFEEHGRILAAIQRRRSSVAERLAREHIAGVGRRRLSSLIADEDHRTKDER